MKNYNDKILESFIEKKQKENEVSLNELLEYRFWQYKNLSEKTNKLKTLLEKNFNKTLNVGFHTKISEPHFTIGHKKWSGSGMSDINIDNITFRFMLDEEYKKILHFIDTNNQLFAELCSASSENNILGNSDISTYDTAKQFAITSRDNKIELAHNYHGFDLTKFNSFQFNDLSIVTPFSFGVDYINQSKNNIKTDNHSYYFYRKSIIKKLILKSILEKGTYKGQNINPFNAIMIDESNLPIDIVTHVKKKRVSNRIY